MGKSKHQRSISSRTSPAISTRSKFDQKSIVSKKDVGQQQSIKQNKIENKKLKNELTNSKKAIMLVKNSPGIDYNTKSQSAENMSSIGSSSLQSSSPPTDGTDDTKSTKLPSISNILGQELWPQRGNTTFKPYTRRSDPFYPDYTSFRETSPENGNTKLGSSQLLDANTAFGVETLSQLKNSGNKKTTRVVEKSSKGKDVPSHQKGGVKINMKVVSKESTVSPESEVGYESSFKVLQFGESMSKEELLPEVKSKSKIKIQGTHTFQSSQNKQLRKELPKRDKKIKRWTPDEDELIIYQKETLKKSWKDIEVLLDSKHSWQAIQMRYLRCHKTRNSTWKESDEQRLLEKLHEDFENRDKRILVEMGPSFSAHRVAVKISELATESNNKLLKFYAENITKNEDIDDYEDKDDIYDEEVEFEDKEENFDDDDDDDETGDVDAKTAAKSKRSSRISRNRL